MCEGGTRSAAATEAAAGEGDARNGAVARRALALLRQARAADAVLELCARAASDAEPAAATKGNRDGGNGGNGDGRGDASGRDGGSEGGASRFDVAAQVLLAELLTRDATLAAFPPRAAYVERLLAAAARRAGRERCELAEPLLDLLAPIWAGTGVGAGGGQDSDDEGNTASVGYVSHTLSASARGSSGLARVEAVSARCDANVLAGNTGMAVWDAGLRLGAALLSGADDDAPHARISDQTHTHQAAAAIAAIAAGGHVLELGCGTGFSSLCALAAGAGGALATDGDAAAVKNAAHNAWRADRTGAESIDERSRDGGDSTSASSASRCRCEVLWWQDTDVAASEEFGRLGLGEGGQSGGEGGHAGGGDPDDCEHPYAFAAVLAADVAYDPESVGALSHTLGWALRARLAPVALIANARRTPGALETFRAELESCGLRVDDFAGSHGAPDETPEEAVAALSRAFVEPPPPTFAVRLWSVTLE